jgi:diguanylate cyclase (GGDEF)-like protein
MKNRLFSLENLIAMSILLPFALFFITLWLNLSFAYYDYLLFIGLGFVMIFALNLGFIPGLLVCGLLIFAYGSIIFYQLLVGYSETWTLNYLWFLFYPLGALLTGSIKLKLIGISKEYDAFQHLTEKSVNIDVLTGFGNSRELLRDLDREMSRAKRYKVPLTLAIIQIQYFDEILAIYGEEDSSNVYKALSAGIDRALRVEDLRFRLEADLFSLVLPHTSAEDALIVKNRIKKELDQISIEDNSSLNRYRVEVKIGLLQYNDSMANPMIFKALTLKELEYDV